MDYYLPNFNKLWVEELGENDVSSVLSLTKANTHFEPSLYEQPEETIYSMINPDDHSRMLTDPAYRLQKQTEGQ
jgi:hypothetical protein